MYEVEGVEILHPWSTESDSDGNANAYLTISNNTDKDISLTKISTEISSMYMIMSNEKMVKRLIIIHFYYLQFYYHTLVHKFYDHKKF